MVEFIKMTCRKNVKRRIRTEKKLLRVETLFKWLCLSNWFLDSNIVCRQQYWLFVWHFISSKTVNIFFRIVPYILLFAAINTRALHFIFAGEEQFCFGSFCFIKLTALLSIFLPTTHSYVKFFSKIRMRLSNLLLTILLLSCVLLNFF